ncbi:stress protein [Bacillus pumilus]|uniref:stress protein n=1 Tax=Bacillus pumilus TaxID=1408 RepID=UPI003817AFA5
MSKTSKFVVSSMIATSMVAAPLSLTTFGQTAEAATTTGVDGSVSIDPIAIADKIEQAVKSSQNRDGFVKNAAYSAFYEAGQNYNVVVQNLSQDHDFSGLNNVVYYDSVEYDGITFGIWVFEDGTFVNNGDGGYINWTFVGSFDREEGSGTVDFHKRF